MRITAQLRKFVQVGKGGGKISEKASSAGTAPIPRSATSSSVFVQAPQVYHRTAQVWVREEKSRSQKRRGQGQKTRRQANTMGQDKRHEPKASDSPRASHCSTASSVGRRKENAGCDESRLRHQRRRGEGSGTRSGSFRGGAALSQERRSRKRRRNA